MQTQPRSLFRRQDTLFGVCEAIGQDFGFNPGYLRALLAVSLLWNPEVVLITYAVLGVAVALSRWLFRAPRAAPRPAVVEAAPNEAREPVALAA